MSDKIRQRLRSDFPWPEERPDFPHDNHGWFFGQRIFPKLMQHRPETIIEVGTWLGKSARWMCRHQPEADVICVDHWLGSIEHGKMPDTRKRLPDLYERFLANCWEFRERIFPVRDDSVSGLKFLSSIGVEPDFIYIDAAHDEISVEQDVRTALTLFPSARLCGDDFNWKGVYRGIRKVLVDLGQRERLRVVSNRIWFLSFSE